DGPAQAELAAGQHAHFGRLLGHQRRLALRQDDHRRDQLQPWRDVRQEAEQDEWFVELAVDVVRALPTGVTGRIGAEHVVVYLQVLEPHALDGLRVSSHAGRVRPNLGLRKDDSDLHWRGLLNPGESQASSPGRPALPVTIPRPG